MDASSQTRKEFGRWLQAERKERGWTVRELGRRAGVSHAAISNVLNGKRNAGPELVRKVAVAMGIPVAEAFRRANLLPGSIDEPPSFQELRAIMRELSPAERRQVLEYARWRLQENAPDAQDQDAATNTGE